MKKWKVLLQSALPLKNPLDMIVLVGLRRIFLVAVTFSRI